MMVINIKFSKNNWVNIVCVYRQWNIPSNMGKLNSESPNEQLTWFKHIMNVVKTLKTKGKSVIIAGDVNLDIHPPNDPLSRADTRNMIEEYTNNQ